MMMLLTTIDNLSGSAHSVFLLEGVDGVFGVIEACSLSDSLYALEAVTANFSLSLFYFLERFSTLKQFLHIFKNHFHQ